MYVCAILEDLELMGFRYHLMVLVVMWTLAKCKTREKSVRRNTEREIINGHSLETTPFFGHHLSVAPFL